MIVWAIFTDTGIPRWFGPEPTVGAEALEFDDDLDPVVVDDLLKTYRRTPEGDWVLRDPVIPPEPTAEQIAAEAEANYQAAVAAWEVTVSAAIQASDAARAYLWGEMTLTAYRAAAQAVRDSIPAPER